MLLPSDEAPVSLFLQEQICYQSLRTLNAVWMYVRVGIDLHMRVGVQKKVERHTQQGKKCLTVKHSEQNTDMNTEYEYEYKPSLSCMPEHVLITAEACV